MTPRVLVLTPYYYPVIGGVESNAERFARYLLEAGVPVTVLTKRSTVSPTSRRTTSPPLTALSTR